MPMTTEPQSPSFPLTLVLPSWLIDDWADLFEMFGFGSIYVCPDMHFITEDEIERLQMSASEPLVALEWQINENSTYMRDLLQHFEIQCPILMCQNYREWQTEEARTQGYIGVMPLGGDLNIQVPGPSDTPDKEGIERVEADIIKPFPDAGLMKETIVNSYLDYKNASAPPK